MVGLAGFPTTEDVLLFNWTGALLVSHEAPEEELQEHFAFSSN